MLRTSTKSIVEAKILICMSSSWPQLRRHPVFPRPESTAVEMTIVTPKPHSEAATMTMSSAIERLGA
jgi:hypothetical protein